MLTFDILSCERDANRLILILAQGARVRDLFWQRLLIRSGLVLALTPVIALWTLWQQGEANPLVSRPPISRSGCWPPCYIGHSGSP